MDENRFLSIADQFLEELADQLDEGIGDAVDVELLAGILTLDLPQGGQYVINKHAPNRQIWLSSPVSGAWHFDYDGADWVSTREPRSEFLNLLATELSAALGQEVVIEI